MGQSFARIIETEQGSYDWRTHNRIRSSVYDYMRHGGKGKRFTVIQEKRPSLPGSHDPYSLVVVVTRVE